VTAIKPLQNALVSLRELSLTAGPVLLLAAALLTAAYLVVQPQPPRHVVLATGVDHSAYAEFGARYAQMLRTHGIHVELKPTQGAADNLALLRRADSGVDLAFVQGGADGAEAAGQAEHEDGLISLGNVFYEPIWLFYREDAARRRLKQGELKSLTQLPGWHVDIGEPGSGVPPLVERLLGANQVDLAALRFSRLPLTPAVMALLSGELDAIVLASAPESSMIQMLLQTPGIRLFSFSQAEAYARRFPFMSAVTLPRGVVNLARDEPSTDMRLLAPMATLVGRDSLHPALKQLFAQAAVQIHSAPGWFQRKGEFPNAAVAQGAVDSEALRVYRSGQPWLQRYLPFWLANLAERMWLVLLAIVAVVIPLSRVVPPLYAFRIRSRIFRWYGQLRDVEAAIGRRSSAQLSKELDTIEEHVGQIKVPLSYADELYALRQHIDWVRQRVEPAAA
jgi:TRAP-type uncharacterized transport system substrate-binding protein